MNPRLWKVGTSELAMEQQRVAGKLPSLPAEITKAVDDRRRLKTTMECTVGEQLIVELQWRDGAVTFGVEVYAVHPDYGVIDVRDWKQFGGDEKTAHCIVRKAV